MHSDYIRYTGAARSSRRSRARARARCFTPRPASPCACSLLWRSRQLRPQRALNLGNDLVVGDRLARLVLVDHLRLHVELRRELLLREALGVACLRDREPQVLGDGLVLELLVSFSSAAALMPEDVP